MIFFQVLFLLDFATYLYFSVVVSILKE